MTDTFTWHFDIENIPRGEIVDRTMVRDGKVVVIASFRPIPVIVAVQGIVTISRWLPKQANGDGGRWDMLATGQQPEAWMPFPTYPRQLATAPKSQSTAKQQPASTFLDLL